MAWMAMEGTTLYSPSVKLFRLVGAGLVRGCAWVSWENNWFSSYTCSHHVYHFGTSGPGGHGTLLVLRWRMMSSWLLEAWQAHNICFLHYHSICIQTPVKCPWSSGKMGWRAPSKWLHNAQVWQKGSSASIPFRRVVCPTQTVPVQLRIPDAQLKFYLIIRISITIPVLLSLK